jgi:hypothetical protein
MFIFRPLGESVKKRIFFVSRPERKVRIMDTSEFKINSRAGFQEHTSEDIFGMCNPEIEQQATELMDTINATPLGRLLSIISSLPEIRHEKVCDIRGRLDRGEYELNTNLDVAMDRVLEEFIAD